MTTSPPACLMEAWQAHEAEMLVFLRHHLRDHGEAEDVLQDVFIKALRQGSAFCRIDNPRAWLFRVARNTVTDRRRRMRPFEPLPEEQEVVEADPGPVVDELSQCLPRVLSELSEEDRVAITFCDIDGGSQQALADHLGISLSGAKSRVQRARERLRAQLVRACQVRFDEQGQVCCFVPRPPMTT